MGQGVMLIQGGPLRDIQHWRPLWDKTITVISNLIFKKYDKKHAYIESIIILHLKAAYSYLSNISYHTFAIRNRSARRHFSSPLSKSAYSSTSYDGQSL